MMVWVCLQGGFSIANYHDPSKVDGIQCEAPGEVRNKGSAMRTAYAKALAR